jgi:tetratricopeptide (TPR) repeat protein
MARQFIVWLSIFFAIAGAFCGCKQPSIRSDASTFAASYQPQFQNESQFVVRAIVSDIAEEIYFAKHRRLPDPKHFATEVTETGGSANAPVYHIRIRFDSKVVEQDLELRGDCPIWSPALYESVARRLGEAVKLRSGGMIKIDDTDLISKCLDSTPETIEQENQKLSSALESHFTDPRLHEKAALLLGAFALREHSGAFFEIRSPLSRMTAHLVMAQLLCQTNTFGINGQLAEAMMLTMINDQALALECLAGVDTHSAAAAAMVRGLRARITGDYRPLIAETNCSAFEAIQCFYAMADRVDLSLAWPKLSEEERQSIDFVRIANELKPRVEEGNELIGKALPLELQEMQRIYGLQHPGQQPDLANIGAILNVPPKHCFEVGSGNKTRICVIGWGQWAMFFQRQICHAAQSGFRSLDTMLGDHDSAKEFAAHCDQSYGSLTLYPFVRRFNATEILGYHQAVDDAFKLTESLPQFVPASCWYSLLEPVSFAPRYNPHPNPRINEWHNHNPLPGTVYDLASRTAQLDLSNFEKLHELAPYDQRVSELVLQSAYKRTVTYEEAMALYREMLPYSPRAMRAIAVSTLYGRPEQYEQLMSQAAEINPRYYYGLGEYEFRMNNFTREDKAAEYYQKGYDADPDRVGASYHAGWLINYWLKHRRPVKAGEIAEEAGNVYSFAGLCAKAVFQEATSNYDGAFETLANLEERYDDSTPLLNFCFSYKAKTGDAKFDPELQKRVGKLFPKGMEKVSLADFKGPPTDGVAFSGANQALYTNHMEISDVIVAVYGVRVHGMAQYTFARTLKDTPELDLIVWQGDAYHELRPYVSGHLFGVNIADYNPYQIGR